jgi:L-lactate utilization protein LutC
LKDFFKKILGIKEEEPSPEKNIESIPLENFTIKKEEIAIDERFAQNFTETGGKFIYCINEQDILKAINEIVLENNWDEILSFDDYFNIILERSGITFSQKTGINSAFITSCEALIAHDGSILISSNQLKGRKLSNLPYDFIILAKVKDLLEDRSDGLRSINLRYSKDIPSGITTIKGPKTVTGSNNILDSGSINTSKNIYLLLVE